MKIIDLLNKIANGEKVPNKIKCDGVIYNYEFQNTITGAYEYRSQNNICLMNNMAGHLYLTDILNSEVEIIEDEFIDIQEITIRDKTIGFPNGEWTARNMDKAFSIKINNLIKNQKKIIERLKDGE